MRWQHSQILSAIPAKRLIPWPHSIECINFILLSHWPFPKCIVRSSTASSRILLYAPILGDDSVGLNTVGQECQFNVCAQHSLSSAWPALSRPPPLVSAIFNALVKVSKQCFDIFSQPSLQFVAMELTEIKGMISFPRLRVRLLILSCINPMMPNVDRWGSNILIRFLAPW